MSDLHGGNIYKIRRELKISKVNDFSVNLNPLGIPKKLIKCLKNNIKIISQYPDPDYTEIKEELSKYLGIDENFIISGNGATELISLYAGSVPNKKVLIVAPTFSEYENAFKRNNAKIDYFYLKEENDFNLDIDDLIKKVKNYDVLVICNPNNPTGNFISLERMAKIAHECLKSNTNLFIDEAFIEFIENYKNHSAINIFKEYKNIFILRALTKFFAVPGLRIGYGITGDEKLLETMGQLQDIWNINILASFAAKVVLNDKKYIESSFEIIKAERDFLYQKLGKIENLKVYKPESNFILVKILNGMSSVELKKLLLEKYHTLIRDCSNFRYLDDRFFRIAVKKRKANLHIYLVLKNIFS